MKPDTRFVIVGLGLMGGSYAMALSRQGFAVSAIDRDEAALCWAVRQGLVERTATPDAAGPLLADGDVVVLALYPEDILPWIQQNKRHLKPGALLTDLAGVKGCYLAQAQAALLPQHELIACHPMAGREVSGVQNADCAIFERANFLIVPTPENTARGIAFAQALGEALGFARITRLSVEQHDRAIGYVSQLTHAIAVSLMNACDDPMLPLVTGDSFRDLTRIADINGGLWSGLFLANAPALLEEIDGFQAALGDLRQKLADGDEQGLRRLFAASTARRREFGKKPETE